MEIKSKLCTNAMRKVGMLLVAASDLGMETSGYGFANENLNSGNVYLWLEDYLFTLFIPLGDDSIRAIWYDPYDGEEHEIEVGNMSLDDLCTWCEDLARDRKEK